MKGVFRPATSMAGSLAMQRLRKLALTAISDRPNRENGCNLINNNQQLSVRRFSSENTVSILFIDRAGEKHSVRAEVGQHLLDVAHNNNIDLEGACGGELACSTCHLIFDQDVYDSLPPKSDEEDDMLDLAFELTDTSRLGCQIRVTKELDGISVRIPDDGY